MRKSMIRLAGLIAGTAAAIVAAPAAAFADVIDGPVNVDVYAPVNVVVHDVLNNLTAVLNIL